MGTAALWRCPGCGTLQAESGSCFICFRSASSCATCANFRRSVVSGVGYCATDRRHEPLTGAEQRPCWTNGTDGTAEGLFAFGEAPRAAGRGLIELS
jgi:hypothetical protein